MSLLPSIFPACYTLPLLVACYTPLLPADAASAATTPKMAGGEEVGAHGYSKERARVDA